MVRQASAAGRRWGYWRAAAAQPDARLKNDVAASRSITALAWFDTAKNAIPINGVWRPMGNRQKAIDLFEAGIYAARWPAFTPDLVMMDSQVLYLR